MEWQIFWKLIYISKVDNIIWHNFLVVLVILAWHGLLSCFPKANARNSAFDWDSARRRCLCCLLTPFRVINYLTILELNLANGIDWTTRNRFIFVANCFILHWAEMNKNAFQFQALFRYIRDDLEIQPEYVHCFLYENWNKILVNYKNKYKNKYKWH